MAIHSTYQACYWNYPNGWQEVVNYLNLLGYKVVFISKERGNYMGNASPGRIVDKSGDIPIEDRIVDIKHADMLVGVSSGLSWLSWAIGTPTVIVSGCTKPWYEPSHGIERVFNPNVCNGCFNDDSVEFDRWNWKWCPYEKGFECTKTITPNIVIEAIDRSLKSGK